MSNIKIELNKTYRYDVVFSDETVGQLILSPSGIILKEINQKQSEILKDNYIDILSCKTIPEGMNVTLLELMPIGMNGHINIFDETLLSSDTYLCKRAIIGKSFKSINDIKFSEISIIYDSIRQWYGSTVDYNFDEANNVVYKIPINTTILESHSVGNFNFDIICKGNIFFNAYKDTIPNPNYSVNFNFNKNQKWTDLLECLFKWRIIYSIFMGQIEVPQAVILKNHNELNEYSYYYPIGITSHKLHYMQIPIRYNLLSQNFQTILSNWFNMDDCDRQNIVYFYESIDETKSIKERFLASFKLLEGIVGRGKEKFFNEIEIEEIKNNLRNFANKNYPNNNDVEKFILKLNYTNEHKLDTQDNIKNYVDNNDDYKFVHLGKSLISDLVKYRNILSHNNSFSDNEKIDYNKVNEGCLKFIILGYLYFLKKYDIPYEFLSIARLNWFQILQCKSMLCNEIIIELTTNVKNDEKIENLQEQYKNLNIRFISSNPQNMANGYDSMIFINLTNNKLEKCIPAFIQKFIKIFGKTEYKKGIYYIDNFNHIVIELPNIHEMTSREYSDCLKELFNKLDRHANILDSSRLITYDIEKKQWV